MMQLIITGFTYHGSTTKNVQGIKGNRVPRNAIAGGNGSFVVAVPPQVLVDLEDVETGNTYSLDMYANFKQMLYRNGYGKLTLNRAVKIADHYKSIQPFAALYWDTWQEVDLKAVLG